MDIHSIVNIIEKDSKILEILKYCPYDILKHWSIRDYGKGQIIFRQGEVYNSFCIAVSGFIDIYVMAENGKRYSQAIYTKEKGIIEIVDNSVVIKDIDALKAEEEVSRYE